MGGVMYIWTTVQRLATDFPNSSLPIGQLVGIPLEGNHFFSVENKRKWDGDIWIRYWKMRHGIRQFLGNIGLLLLSFFGESKKS